jgi:NADPH2:quinone reductase
MKAAVIYEVGGPDVFRYEVVADPEVGPKDLLVRMQFVSIEGGDTLNRLRGEHPVFPHIVGYQAAGVVESIGSGVVNFEKGDRVVTVGQDGSHAELRSVNELFAWKIPDGLDTRAASSVPVPWGTAHDCLFEFGRIQAGETALIHAGASGVGIAAIQLAKRAGATVLATASSDQRLERLRAYGMDHGINYAREDFVVKVRELTEGRGADVIVDSIGGSNLQKSLHCLAYRGRCLTFGDAGREETTKLDISTMRGNNQSLTGYFLGAELFLAPRAHQMVADILDDMAKGSLEAVTDKEFTLERAGEAHAYIESRQAFGRVLLTP